MREAAFERGDLIWLDFTPQSGHEQKGRRPALVISPGVYNQVSSCILVCPITSNTAPWPWKVDLPEGLELGGAVLVDQLKSIDPAARRAAAANDTLPPDLMADILARLATLTG